MHIPKIVFEPMSLQSNILNKIGTDKVLHFLVGALVTSMVSPIGWTAVTIAFFVVLFLSLVKELMLDAKKDWLDVLAGGIGSGLSIAVYGLIHLLC